MTVTEEELSKACAKVGHFLHEFALVEQEINQCIVQILDLKGDAADWVVRKITFGNKSILLKIAALETAPPEERETMNELFTNVSKQNKNRNVMAHRIFEPADNDGVQFWPTVANDDSLWTKQRFEDSYQDLHAIRENLKQLRPKLTFHISEEGKTETFSHYLYTHDYTHSSTVADILSEEL